MQDFNKGPWLLFIVTLLLCVHTKAADFNYISEYEFTKMKLVKSGTDCLEYDWEMNTTYPEITTKFTAQGELYRPKTGSDIPVVILFPPVGGKNFLDEGLAETLCTEGIATFLPTTDFTGIDQAVPPPVEDHDHALYRIVATSKAFIAYSREHYKLNGDHVGMFGASLGGIVGSYAMGAIPEVQAGYFVAAGGDVPHILATSKQERVTRLKEIRRQQVGFTNDQEYEAWLRQHLQEEPLIMAQNIPSPDMTHLVISDNDTFVPTSTQYLLLDALGTPSHDRSSSSHVWTIYNAMSSGAYDIVYFFKQQFKKDNARLDQQVIF